jgi:hypothetical protein
MSACASKRDFYLFSDVDVFQDRNSRLERPRRKDNRGMPGTEAAHHYWRKEQRKIMAAAVSESPALHDFQHPHLSDFLLASFFWVSPMDSLQVHSNCARCP